MIFGSVGWKAMAWVSPPPGAPIWGRAADGRRSANHKSRQERRLGGPGGLRHDTRESTVEEVSFFLPDKTMMRVFDECLKQV
jgi:hypothetical protein